MPHKPTRYAAIVTSTVGTPLRLDQVGMTRPQAVKRAIGLTDSAPTRINGDPAEFGRVLTERQARKHFTW